MCSRVFGKESLDIRKIGLELVIRKFEKSLKSYINASNKLIEQMISKAYGNVDMPDYVSDINFFQVGNIIILFLMSPHVV